MITLYGHPQTRSFRCLWMLNELGVDYEHVPTHYRNGGTRVPEFLAINPNARVPALVDGDLCLWESMAINLYLAKRYDNGLWPASPEDQARTVQWSFWVMTGVEPPLLQLLMHNAILPEDRRDAKSAKEAASQLVRPLEVLEGALDAGGCLLGSTFTVADLNVASVLAWAKIARLKLTECPGVSAWLDKCLDRPAARKARS